MKFLTVIGVTAFFAASAFADPAADVRCREIAFSKSVETRDADLFASFIDADARFVGNSVLHGPAAIAEAWGVFFSADGPSILWRPQFVEVLDEGTLALTRGPYRMLSKDEQGVESENWGTFNSVWRLHEDGQWRVVFDAGSPSSEAPAEAVQALLDEDDTCS